MKQIVLNYRQSLSGSWVSSPLTADALSCRVYVLPEMDTSNSEIRRSAGKKCQTIVPRLQVDLVLSPTNFDPDMSASGDANWLYVQSYYIAPQRKLQYLFTTQAPNLDGFTCFNTDNTVYLNLEDLDINFEDYDVENRRIRYVVLHLESVDPYTL